MKTARVDPATQYAVDVVLGGQVACEWERLACERHLRDLERAKSADFEYTFDLTRADRIYQYFEKYCRHVRGCFSGDTIALDGWQKFILGSIFGWVSKQNGARRFGTAYIRVARGNAKSTLMSGIACYGMTADAQYVPGDYGNTENYRYEAQPEVACVAVDRNQAQIVWGDAKKMAEGSPDICKSLFIGATKISHRTRGGQLVKLSRDIKNKDGGAPCIIVVDEYHAHPTSMVKDVTSSGKGKRSQCLEFIITTAGEDAENKPCKLEDDIVKQILKGEIPNDTYFGIIFELDKADDPHDETTWIKANPIFQADNDYSKTLLKQVKEEHDLAYGSGDNNKKRQWLIKRVNLWQYDSAERYMGGYMDRWRAAAVKRKDFLDLTHGHDCIIGVDLSKRIDLTAVGLIFDIGDGRLAVTAHGFIPMETAEAHKKSDRVPYHEWAKAGWCTLIPGAVIDDDYVRQYIQDREFDFGWRAQEICYDPYSARQFSIAMDAAGYTCVEVRQGVQTLSEPTKSFREKVIKGEVVHDGNPILTWCLANAVEQTDTNGNIKLSKKNKDDSQRIDLAAAVMNAATRTVFAETSSIYESRGLRALGD